MLPEAGIGDDFKISGGNGPDTIIGASGDDTLFGGLDKNGGQDFIQAGAGRRPADRYRGQRRHDGRRGWRRHLHRRRRQRPDRIQPAATAPMSILNPLTFGTVRNTLVERGKLGRRLSVAALCHRRGRRQGGYDAVTNGANTIIDTRTFGINPTGLNGYLEYDRRTSCSTGGRPRRPWPRPRAAAACTRSSARASPRATCCFSAIRQRPGARYSRRRRSGRRRCRSSPPHRDVVELLSHGLRGADPPAPPAAASSV